MPVLSVVVPIYNTANYLVRCIESLLHQTLEDIEIILVNDGSTDHSQVIIDSYVLNYPHKIRAYLKLNGGLSVARNYGVKFATGDYIAFVDSDDWVDLGLYKSMYNVALSYEHSIVCCNYVAKHVGFDKIYLVDPQHNMGNRYLGNLIAWNKIYRREFWLTHCFAFYDGLLHEDMELIPRVLSIANSIGYIDDAYYFYEKRNQTSITSGNTLHIKHFPIIYTSLITWYKLQLRQHDDEFAVYVADVAYKYLMLESDVVKAKEFFIKNIEIFSSRCLLSYKRYVMIRLLKLNFNCFHQLNICLKRLK